MRILLAIIEGLCWVILAIIGILARRLGSFLSLSLIVVMSCAFLMTVGINELLTEIREEELNDKIDEIRNSLFRTTGELVMEAPEEVLLPPTHDTNSNIRIIVPQDGSLVSWRPYVEGTVADPYADVWVIVHPMEVSDFWVQPRVTVKKDGTWKVCVYIGSGPEKDVGKLFEMMAVANPTEELFEGKVLSGWPAAQLSSQVVTVTRE